MTTTITPWKPATELEANPINLPRETAEKLVPQLDELLSSFVVLFHQYQKHHWLVEGPQFRDVHLFLEQSYTEIHQQVDAIAERMTALGGVPTSSPVQQAKKSFIEHEPEGIFRIRDMLTRDREAEGTLAKEMRRVIANATAEGDYGTETLLKGILVKVEDRAHHLDHFLGEDSLGLALPDDAS